MPPARTIDQRMIGLEVANRTRAVRARVKLDIRAERRSLASVLLNPEPEVENMKVWDVLLAQPKHGRVKVTSVLRRHQISPSKTVGGLTERQLHALLD